MGVSIRAFARRIGVHHEAVRKAIAHGRISQLRDGTIDAARAEKQWRASAHPGRGKGGVTANGNGGAAKNGKDGADNYRTARTALTALDARLRELDLRQRMGELVEAEDVRRDAFNAARRARDQLNAIPVRLAPVVAGLTDINECRLAIKREIDRALDELHAPSEP